jgi:multicomponent Na+:H+ antiporter subunit B
VVSGVLLLGALAMTTRHEAKARPRGRGWQWGPLLAAVATGALLLYGTRDFPGYALANTPANANEQVALHYNRHTEHDMGHGVPNIVTAVLAHYRGYDTLFETTVTFTAGVTVILLLRPVRRREEHGAPHGPSAAPQVHA